MTIGSYQCGLVISNPKVKIHYASEWDPRLPAHTKGGYLEGRIVVPDYEGPMRMTIQSYPAPGKGMEDALKAAVHPALLHNVRMGRGKREQDKEPVPSDCHWRQQYKIQDGEVTILNQLSALDSGRSVPLQDEVTRVRENTIRLGRRNQELNLIIVQPKQRARADGGEATVTKVLRNRLQNSSSQSIDTLEKSFKGAQYGKNMKQVRLKVEFTDLLTNEVIAETLSAETICDHTNKHIGPLDLADASPLKSCDTGGRKIIIVSEQKLPQDVKPIFQLWSGDTERKDLEQYISQPSESDIKVRLDSIIFLTPPQPLLARLDSKDLTLKLAVKRTEDGHVSHKKFIFQYEQHNLHAYCHHFLDTDQEVNLNQTKKGKRSYFKVPSPLNISTARDTIEMVNSSKTEEDSEGSNSPNSSGYMSSPFSIYESSPEREDYTYEPSIKVPRYITQEVMGEEMLIPTTVTELSDNTCRASNTNISQNGVSYEDVLDDIKPDDVQEFSRYIERLPLIAKDGGRRAVLPNDPKVRAELEVVSNELQINERNGPSAPSVDYLSYMSKLVFFFFIFLFLQALAFIFLFEEEEDIPLFEFSSSSILFSITSIIMES